MHVAFRPENDQANKNKLTYTNNTTKTAKQVKFDNHSKKKKIETITSMMHFSRCLLQGVGFFFFFLLQTISLDCLLLAEL